MLQVTMGIIGTTSVLIGGYVCYKTNDRVRNIAQPYLNYLYCHPFKTWTAIRVEKQTKKYEHVELVARVLYGLDNKASDSVESQLTSLPFKNSYVENLKHPELVVWRRRQ